jgi:hypothetical protein
MACRTLYGMPQLHGLRTQALDALAVASSGADGGGLLYDFLLQLDRNRWAPLSRRCML